MNPLASATEGPIIRPFVTLTPGEIRALNDLSARHPHTCAQISEFRDEGDVGWSLTHFEERINVWPYIKVTRYIMSPTGRAWKTTDGQSRGEQVRGQDYDPSPRAPR